MSAERRIEHAPLRTIYVPPPGVDLVVPYRFLGSSYDEQELDAVERVVRRGWLTTGYETVEFEKQFAAAHDVPYAFAVSSCTTALHAAAQLCALGPGDEVVTTPTTFVATNQPILACGAVPVFADVDDRTWNIDPEQVEARITDRTKAIFLTHIAGQVCDMDPIMELAERHGLVVVEDAAHAPGAAYKGRPAGSLGDIGCFSFHAVKNMTTLGEGGMLTTRHDDFALKIPWLRSMGSRYVGDPHEDGTPGPRQYDIARVNGFVPSNIRMNEAQAAVGQVQLAKLPSMNERRRHIARTWNAAWEGIEGLRLPYESPDGDHVWHLYVLATDPEHGGVDRDALVDRLLNVHGVHCIPGLYQPSYVFSLYADRPDLRGSCPNAEWIAANSLQLPIYPELSDEQVGHVADAVAECMDALRRSPSVAAR